MPSKEAVDKALNKYYQANKKLNVNVSLELYNLIDDYCKQMNISKRELIEKALTEYLDK